MIWNELQNTEKAGWLSTFQKIDLTFYVAGILEEIEIVWRLPVDSPTYENTSCVDIQPDCFPF